MMLKIVTRNVDAKVLIPYTLISIGVIGANPTRRIPNDIRFNA